MSVVGRIGYWAVSVACLTLVAAIVNLLFGELDADLWVLSLLLLLVGLSLLLRDPLARQMGWRLLWSASPTGTWGGSLTLFATIMLVSIVRTSLMHGYSINRWWIYLVLGVAALVSGAFMIVRFPPIKSQA